MLDRLTRTLQDESFRWAKVETGMEPIVVGVGGIHENEGSYPFAMGFRLTMYEPQSGRREFTVTISETLGLR